MLASSSVPLARSVICAACASLLYRSSMGACIGVRVAASMAVLRNGGLIVAPRSVRRPTMGSQCSSRGWSRRTLAVQGMGRIDQETRAIVPPIHVSTTYIRDPDNGYSSGFMYGRPDNQTVREAE